MKQKHKSFVHSPFAHDKIVKNISKATTNIHSGLDRLHGNVDEEDNEDVNSSRWRKNSEDAPSMLSRRKYATSTPHNLGELKSSDFHTEHVNEETKKRKKKFSLRKLLFKNDNEPTSPSNGSLQKSQSSVELEQETAQVTSELEFVHNLMLFPQELGLETAEEPDLEVEAHYNNHNAQTMCEIRFMSKAAVQYDALLKRIDLINARVITLSNLASTVLLVGEVNFIEFVVKNLDTMRQRQCKLITEADDLLPKFFKNPKLLINFKKRRKRKKSRDHLQQTDKVIFKIHGDEDDDDVDDKIDKNCNQFKLANVFDELNLTNFTGNSSTESDINESNDETDDFSSNEDMQIEEVINLAREIRKVEGSRFKQKFLKQSSVDKKLSFCILPPPPNPLGHVRNDLLRVNTTAPSGLCRKVSETSISTVNSSHLMSVGRFNVQPSMTFNLLSLSGQLSWLISEYLERGSSTHKWASHLINSISRMSVDRSTWLSVHQQLRETTELLYQHSAKQSMPSHCLTREGDTAWQNLHSIYQHQINVDLNNETITADRSRSFQQQQQCTVDLVPLVILLEKKLHLAYLCDLILWRIHRALNLEQIDLERMHHQQRQVQLKNPADTSDKKIWDEISEIVKCQLMNFQIRLFELQLDQWNSQTWPLKLTDRLICWINGISEGQMGLDLNLADHRYCLMEFKTFKQSVKSLITLVKTIMGCKLMHDILYETNNQVETTRADVSEGIHHHPSQQNQHQHHHHHHHHHHHQHAPCHPHQVHHELGEFRCMNIEQCSQSHTELVKQIRYHAQQSRPLRYFAERALYDIALELGCTIDWDERYQSLSIELESAWDEWEKLLQQKVAKDL